MRAVTERDDSPCTDDIASIVFVESLATGDQRTYTHSTAVVRILRTMGGFWWLPGIALTIVPRPIRDCLYRVLATHRYQWFGENLRSVRVSH